MRDFIIVQELGASVEECWRTFFDPEFEQACVKTLQFREYEILEHRDTETSIYRRTRAVPRLDAAAAVGRLFGARFGYVEEGTFDKAAQVYKTCTIPDTFGHRMRGEMVMRIEPAGPATSRRTLAFHIEAHVPGIGGLVESGFEKNLRSGWKESTAVFNDWLQRAAAARR
jgi:hypothetical protein